MQLHHQAGLCQSKKTVGVLTCFTMCCSPWQPRACKRKHKHKHDVCCISRSPLMSPGHLPCTGAFSCTDQPLSGLFSPRADRAASCLIYTVLLTCCCRHRIICVLRSFPGLLGAVASTDFANSCLPSVHISELQEGTKGPFYRHGVEKL